MPGKAISGNVKVPFFLAPHAIDLDRTVIVVNGSTLQLIFKLLAGFVCTVWS